MSKKRKIPKKKKGIRYIAKVLRKYGGKKYKKYNDALSKAREVLIDLKSRGEKAKVKTVLNITRKHRVSKEEPKEAPSLLSSLTDPNPYFFLSDYPIDIFRTSSEIIFVSKLFNKGVEEIEGGKKPSYTKTFSGFVNYLNKEIKEREEAYNYLVMCTPPKYDKKRKKWIVEIIATDPDGEQTTFGYEPTIVTEGEDISRPSKKEQKPKEITKSDEERIKELDLILTKEKSRQQANEMFLKGLYTKKEYKEEIDRINNLYK